MSKNWNFIDPDTGEKTFHPNYKIGFKDGEKIFKVDGKQLVNTNGKPLLDRERNEGFCVNIGKIAGMNAKERSAVIQDRARKHSKKHIPNKNDDFDGYKKDKK